MAKGDIIKADGSVWTKAEQDAALLDTLSIFVDLYPAGLVSSVGMRFSQVLARVVSRVEIKKTLDTRINDISDLVYNIKDMVSDGLGVVNDWDGWDELKVLLIESFISGALDEINKNIKAQFPQYDDIEVVEYTFDGLIGGVGDWLARVVNQTLSDKMGKEVAPFSSFYPPANIVDELDIFLTDEINTKTQLNLSSIVKNPNLATELKDQVQEKFAQAISTKLAEQKARMVDKMAEMEIYGTSKQMRLQTIDSIISEVQEMILQKKVIGFSFDGKQYMQQQYKKMLNRKHQKAYRRLHREQRIWVLRDEPLPP